MDFDDWEVFFVYRKYLAVLMCEKESFLIKAKADLTGVPSGHRRSLPYLRL